MMDDAHRRHLANAIELSKTAAMQAVGTITVATGHLLLAALFTL